MIKNAGNLGKTGKICLKTVRLLDTQETQKIGKVKLTYENGLALSSLAYRSPYENKCL